LEVDTSLNHSHWLSSLGYQNCFPDETPTSHLDGEEEIDGQCMLLYIENVVEISFLYTL